MVFSGVKMHTVTWDLEIDTNILRSLRFLAARVKTSRWTPRNRSPRDCMPNHGLETPFISRLS